MICFRLQEERLELIMDRIRDREDQIQNEFQERVIRLQRGREVEHDQAMMKIHKDRVKGMYMMCL